MKAFAFIAALCLVSFTSMANNDSTVVKSNVTETSVYYGPEKGSVAISFSAHPVINLIGNMFNGTTSQVFGGLNMANPSWYSGSVMSARFYTSQRMAFNVGAGLNCQSNKSYSYTDNNEDEDEVKTSGSNELMLMVGAQYLCRPGKRLQPVLGANLVYVHENKNFTKYTHKQEDDANYDHSAPVASFGVVCNMGVEYFLCKSVSLSAVASLAAGTKKTREKIDDWDDEYSRVTTTSSFASIGKVGANVSVNFYF
jgi:hypothetical protein